MLAAQKPATASQMGHLSTSRMVVMAPIPAKSITPRRIVKSFLRCSMSALVARRRASMPSCVLGTHRLSAVKTHNLSGLCQLLRRVVYEADRSVTGDTTDEI